MIQYESQKINIFFQDRIKKGIEVFDPDLTKVWEEHKRNVIIGYNNVRELDDNRFKYKNLSHFYEQLNINTYTKNHHINICGVVERDQIHVKTFSITINSIKLVVRLFFLYGLRKCWEDEHMLLMVTNIMIV